MSDALIILRRFGDTVKHHRQRLGVSQEEFGFRGNMHRNDAGHFERAERMPMLETILKVAAALEVSPCELLKGIAWKTGRLIPGRFEFEEIKPLPARRRSRQERPVGPVPGWFEIEGRRIPDEEAGS
jgi:transcriptional regulator with XRE-family HTH domain